MHTHNGKNVLSAPLRNRYFYGKLMDVEHFQQETDYHTQKRQLLNRLVIGYGVVCGLGISRSNGMVCLSPGVAIDGYGREIIVPETIRIDPRRLTDDFGRHTGEQLNGREVLICLAYAEAKINPVPVLAPDCAPEGACECSNIREGFAVIVQQRQPPGISFSCSMPDLFSPNDQETPGIYQELVRRISQACPDVREPACVPLALLLPEQEGTVEVDLNVRPLVMNNSMLLELLLCLAERVEQCCAQPATPLVLEQVDYICVRPQGPNQNAGESPQEYTSHTLTEMPPAPHMISMDNELLVAIRVTFNLDIDPTSVRTGVSPSQSSDFSLQVSEVSTTGTWIKDIAVEVIPDPINPSSSFRIRMPENPVDFQVGDYRNIMSEARVAPIVERGSGPAQVSPPIFPSGYYQVTLRGTGPAPIRSKEGGMALDGDWDAIAGGNSIIKFSIQQLI